jgi:Na+-transporting NADH:ubiquinone oxidoreductase subunit C
MQRLIIGKGAYAVSEPLPSQLSNNTRTILFIVVLSLVCALILSTLASVLAEPQAIAKDLDRSKQMMIAAKILSHEGYFLIKDEAGKYIPAKLSKEGLLVPGTTNDIATRAELLEVYKKRLKAMLVDNKGNLEDFEKAGIDEENYSTQFRKLGYYKQPLKLVYEILPSKNNKNTHPKPEGYVIPINGFGLWDAIYGYLALQADGNTVIGTSWYDQKETPGLGANISEAYWQNLFPGKKIFMEGADGKIDLKSAPLGIIVVKGKVAEVLGNSPKANSAVDGMAGATLTGNGVTDAYRDVLSAYRPFLMKVYKANAKK